MCKAAAAAVMAAIITAESAMLLHTVAEKVSTALKSWRPEARI